MLPAILDLFNRTQPLHVVKGKDWPGLDIHILEALYPAATGKAVRFVDPEDLRLVPDKASPTGHRLCCLSPDGELEIIAQVSLELEQHEFKAFSFEMMCQLATCCVNDLRSIFLLNDQRFLAVVYAELGNLATRERVITHPEADLLRSSLVPSYLPGSDVWRKVVQNCMGDDSIKDSWVLKSARHGHGEGHLFGTDVSNAEWLARLSATQTGGSIEAVAHVLQRKIDQVEYDIVRYGIDKPEKFHLVGSFFNINNEFLGVGGFRIARQVQVGLNSAEQGLAMVAFTQNK